MTRPSALSFLTHCACCLFNITSAMPRLLWLAKSTVVQCVCLCVRECVRVRLCVCVFFRQKEFCNSLVFFVAMKWRIATAFKFDQHWWKWFSALFSSLALSILPFSFSACPHAHKHARFLSHREISWQLRSTRNSTAGLKAWNIKFLLHCALYYCPKNAVNNHNYIITVDITKCISVVMEQNISTLLMGHHQEKKDRVEKVETCCTITHFFIIKSSACCITVSNTTC